MKTTGTGSRLSPIAIDDSEDEVLQELVGETSFESNSTHSTTNQRDTRPQNGASKDVSIGYHLDPMLEGDEFCLLVGPMAQLCVAGKTMLKRKRALNESQSGPVADSSHSRLDSSNHTSLGELSKKAKKRRRKAERQALELATQPLRTPKTWVNGDNYLIPELAAPHMLPSWGRFNMGPSKNPMHSTPGPYSTFNIPSYVPRPYPPEIPAASSSSWVASMAMAAETPANDGHKSWDSHTYVAKFSPPSSRNTHIKQYIAEPIALPPPPPAPPPPPSPASVALPPPPVQTIGMKPDHDPSSKHGLFVIPPDASKDGASKGAQYIPNPARTLVMEQLPKSHRTQDFVNSWSKSACGAYPVFLCFDQHGAKALVEFATAELARKAWGSPRLGTALVGLKTHQLKGRPREDLIKVWWYRVDGVGANAGVGEIEEGEIEGDAAEKEIDVPVKKETKKEKKARLHRERQVKKLAMQTKPSAVPMQPSTEAKTTTAEVSGIPKAQSFPLSQNLTMYSHEQGTGYPYYSIAPQPLPHSLPPHLPAPVHLPPPPSRAPLLPQSALDIQWRPKHELPKKPSPETIYSTPTATVSPSEPMRSSSPAWSSTRLSQNGLSLPSPPVSPVYEDMDVDDDMDLESPRTAKRATFDFSSVPNYARILSSQPLSTDPSHVGIPLLTTPSITGTLDLDAPRDSDCDPTTSLSIFEPAPKHAVTQPAANMSPPPSASATPPLEPRAMKNAPKGPSFAKRSLIARQKELEERIAKSKMELGIITTTVPPSPAVIEPVTPMTESPVQEDESSKLAMEERLRSLVLRSQKNRSKASVATTLSTNGSSTSASPISVASTNVFPETAPTSVFSSATTQTFSLDDLAVSFITETLETFKTSPNPPTPTTSALATKAVLSTTVSAEHASAAATTKLELAAKQKRLEAQIAESKILMEKLAKARTKQERETILAAMREQSRAASISEDQSTTPDTSTPQAQILSKPQVQPLANAPSTHMVPVVRKWPGSLEHAGVLIVSDDEDDESDSDD